MSLTSQKSPSSGFWNGRSSAGRRFDKTFGSMAFKRATRAGLPHEDAEEVRQNFMLIAFEEGRPHRNNDDGETFGKWISEVVTNLIHDVFRERKKMRYVDFLDEISKESVIDSINSNEAHCETMTIARVRQIVSTFRTPRAKDRTLMAFYMTAVDGKSTAVVADILKMSQTQVCNSKKAMLKKLWAHLAREFGPDFQKHLSSLARDAH